MATKTGRGRNAERRRRRRAESLGIGELDPRDMDAMHEVSLAEYGVGIGVVVQEEARAEKVGLSLVVECGRTPWWQVAKRWHLNRELRYWQRTRALWSDRLTAICERVARDRTGG